MKTKIAAILIATAFVAAMPAATVAGEGDEGSLDGGGVVNNVIPLVSLLDNDEGATARTGVTDTFFGTVTDNNGEQDIKQLEIEVSGPVEDTFTLDVLGKDWSALDLEPAGFDNDWKVWNEDGLIDGTISFKFEFHYPLVGEYTFNMTALDLQDATSPVVQLVVDVTDGVTPDGPEDLSGNPSALWGAWAADPGQTNVESNFLRVTNTGDFDEQEFSMSFTDDTWTGVTDDTWTIDIFENAQNIEFRCAEASSGDNPSDATGWTEWDYTGAGGANCTFTDGSSLSAGVMFVQYRIMNVPAPMMDQDYEATFTVTPIV